MDPHLLDQVRQKTPDINPRVAEGIAYHQLQQAEAYVDKIIRCAAADFPEGLVYHGSRKCSPYEEFKVSTRPYSADSRNTFEIARSDFYLRAYSFSYKDEPLTERYLYLPFVDRGNRIYIRGNEFAIHPVLSDIGYSLGSDKMFIQLTRARFNFERTVHHIVIDGEDETIFVVWAWIHGRARLHYRKKSNSSKIIYSTMAHYIFAKYGFTQAMEMFAGCQVIVGRRDELPREKYPDKDWVLIESVGLCPRPLHPSQYQRPDIRVAIPRNQWNSTAKNLVGGFFYIADHFPHRVEAEYVDEVWVWKVLLAIIVFPEASKSSGEGTLVLDLEDHQTSLDEYLDLVVLEELQRAGVHVETMYELFIFIIEQLSNRVATTNEEVSSIYNRGLTTLRYVLYDITQQINQLMFHFKQPKKKREELDSSKVGKSFNQFFKMDKVSNLSKGEQHPYVNPVSSSSDNLFLAVTCNMVMQDNASGKQGGKKGKVDLTDPAKHLHVSLADVGSYNVLPKSDPTGRSRINPFVHLGPDDTVRQNPNHTELLGQVQRLLRQ